MTSWRRSKRSLCTKFLCSVLATAITTSSIAPALAVESAQAETFTFPDATHKISASVDASNRQAGGDRRDAPVSSSGAFLHSFSFDVPPGRGQMTPSLGLSYDSSAAQRESEVGLGWSLSTRSISRSTRQGFPKTTLPAADPNGGSPFDSKPQSSRVLSAEYDDAGGFSSPFGELIPVSEGDGPPGPGKLYAPLQETTPVRYRYVPRFSGTLQQWNEFGKFGPYDYWIEYDPSGITRYYGADPFSSGAIKERATVRNRLGVHSWLLLREEDRSGNAITYDYHDIDDQGRPELARAQKRPVLKSITWGQNRKTGLAAQFVLSTEVAPQAGPLDMKNGQTLLTNKITKIRVGTPDSTFWSYSLIYDTSPTTGRQRLRAIERGEDGPSYPTFRRTDFDYQDGSVAFGAPQAAKDLDEVYKLSATYTTEGSPSSSLEGTLNARGFRAGAKFVDYDGDGRNDALYHGAGLRVPQAQILPDVSRMNCTSKAPGNPGPCFAGGKSFPELRFSELADLDGDGDVDPMAFGEHIQVCRDKTYNSVLEHVGAEPEIGTIAPNPSSPIIVQNHDRASGVALTPAPSLPDWPAGVTRSAVVIRKKTFIGNYAFKIVRVPHIKRDFNAPVADINGDGRPDIALLKQFHDVRINVNSEQLLCETVGAMPDITIFGVTLDGGVDMSAPIRVSPELGKRLAAQPRQQAPREIADYLQRQLPDSELAKDFVSGARFAPLSEDLIRALQEDRRRPHPVGIGYSSGIRRAVRDLVVLPPARVQPPDLLSKLNLLGTLDFLGDTYHTMGGFLELPGLEGWEIPGELPGDVEPNPFEDGFLTSVGSKYGPPLWFTGDGFAKPDDGSPAGGGGSSGMNESFGVYHTFVPKIYLAEGRSSLDYSPLEAEGFEISMKTAMDLYLADKLGVESLEELAEMLKHVYWGMLGDGTVVPMLPGGKILGESSFYTTHANHNAFLLDVNSDGLPDLILAEPMHGSGTCVPGHRVLINRGHSFELRKPDQTIPDEWADSPFPDEQWSPLLGLLRNRGRRCAGSKPDTKFSDSPLPAADGSSTTSWPSDVESLVDEVGRFGIPTAAMSPTDIDGDGRVDIVIAYHVKPIFGPDDINEAFKPRTIQKILRNTGRGFEALDKEQVAAILPADFWLAEFIIKPWNSDGLDPFPHVDWQMLTAPDTGRLTDIDGDGLVDIVKPNCPDHLDALCQPGPAHWRRNKGSRPDLLTRVSSSLGSFTEVTYGSALGPNVTLPANGLRPQASAQVATSIRRGASPEGLPLAGAPPVEQIDLFYENHVHDPVWHAFSGFEKVKAVFHNVFDGKSLEDVTVTKTFDVTAEVPGIEPRFPLGGALLETKVTSSDSPGEVTRTTQRYHLAPLGAGVRRRLEASFTQQCKGATCVASGQETLAFDPFGYPTESRRGDSDGKEVIGDATTQLTAYEHHTGAWMLGMPTSQQVFGKAMDISGTWTPDAPLSSTLMAYYPDTGLLQSIQHPGFQAPSCESAGTDDTEQFEYAPEGLLSKTISAKGHIEELFYAPDRLYVEHREAMVTRYVDGVVSGATNLVVKSDFDRRTGKPTRTEDPNGKAQKTEYDSLGRPRKVYVPSPANVASPSVLTEYQYDDDTTPSVDTLQYRKSGVFSRLRAHMDGAGHVLGEVERADGVAVRTSFQRYDAAGHAVEAALATGASGLDDYTAPADPRRVFTWHDGFGRVRQVTRPDGTKRSFAYALRSIDETDPRGFTTHRESDWRGELTKVERRGLNQQPLATHQLVRDGAGRIVEIDDADGTIRRRQYDLGGRLRFVELPHSPASQAQVHAFCHDTDDLRVSSTSPEGRSATTEYDELGRMVHSMASLNGATTESWMSYDDPAVSNGLGRLTRVRDETGITTSHYNSFGRQSYVQRSVAASLLGPSTPAAFATSLVYDYRGNLEQIGINGLNTFAQVLYGRDARGRVTSVMSKGGGDVTWIDQTQFNANNRLTSARFGGAIKAGWTYDPVTLRLTAIHYAEENGVSFAGVAYPEYDQNGNVLKENRHDGAGNLVSQKIHTYDPLSRLATSSLALPDSNQSDSFVYSPAGNLLTAAGEGYTYGQPEHPQAATIVSGPQGSRSLQYSPDGQLLADHMQKPDGSIEERTLTWDPAGCLTAVGSTKGGTSQTTKLVCDSGGRVISRRTQQNGQTLSSRFDLGFGELRPEEGTLVLRLPVNGSVLVEEARSLATGQRVVDKSGYLLNDARGSVLARTRFASSGPPIVEAAEYDAWGATKGLPGLAAPTHQFTGQEPDPGLGLYHFGVRTYDPTLRRWLSPDPLLMVSPETGADIGEQLNLFAYASNNPVGRIDPTGLADCDPSVSTCIPQAEPNQCIAPPEPTPAPTPAPSEAKLSPKMERQMGELIKLGASPRLIVEWVASGGDPGALLNVLKLERASVAATQQTKGSMMRATNAGDEVSKERNAQDEYFREIARSGGGITLGQSAGIHTINSGGTVKEAKALQGVVDFAMTAGDLNAPKQSQTARQGSQTRSDRTQTEARPPQPTGQTEQKKSH